MAYSFIANTTKEIDWKNLNSEIFRPDTAIEMFPIESDESGKRYLGISIPFGKLDRYPDTWDDLVNTIHKLKSSYGFEIFDLYHGFFITDNNINQVKESLLSK